MLRIRKMIILCAIMLCCTVVGACNNKQEEIEIYRELHLWNLQNLDVMYVEQYRQLDELSRPYYQDSIYYPETDKKVSLLGLNYLIYIHNLLEEDDISVTAEEMVNLYYTMDSEGMKKLDYLHDWYIGWNVADTEYDGEERVEIIGTALAQVYYILYPEKCGESYLKTESISELEYGERIAFIEWILANPDYEFAAEYDEYYKFLDWMGLIPESERREVPGKEEELYGAEIYVAE